MVKLKLTNDQSVIVKRVENKVHHIHSILEHQNLIRVLTTSIIQLNKQLHHHNVITWRGIPSP